MAEATENKLASVEDFEWHFSETDDVPILKFDNAATLAPADHAQSRGSQGLYSRFTFNSYLTDKHN